MDRDAQKALFTACAENIGHHSARILYHFHARKAHNSAGFRGHEQPQRAPHELLVDIVRIHERMVFERALDVRLDGGPEIGNELGRDGMDQVRDSPRQRKEKLSYQSTALAFADKCQSSGKAKRNAEDDAASSVFSTTTPVPTFTSAISRFGFV